VRINGEPIVKKNVGFVTVKGFEWKLIPLPLGWAERLMKSQFLVPPAAPERILKDPDKNTIIRDPSTGKAETKTDFKDSAFIQKFNRWTNRRDAVALAYHLDEEESISFDTKRPDDSADKKAWEAYADGILKELSEFGMTDDEMGAVLRVADTISNTVNTEAAVKRFLSSQNPAPEKEPTNPDQEAESEDS
jgi:hypothetical protein